MKVLNSKNKTVIVMSGSGAACPRLIVTEKNITFKDDYHGKLYMKKNVAKHMTL